MHLLKPREFPILPPTYSIKAFALGVKIIDTLTFAIQKMSLKRVSCGAGFGRASIEMICSSALIPSHQANETHDDSCENGGPAY